jgi:hypothetical protein
MECPIQSGQGPELFIAYAAQTLPPATSLALERHLSSCDECCRLAEAQKLVWSALDAWEPQHISSDFDRKLYARIAAEERRPWYYRIIENWSLRPAIPVAAACVVVLAGYLLRETPPTPNPEPRIAVENRVDIEQLERALDDIDMLNQMGVVVPPSQTSPPEPI